MKKLLAFILVLILALNITCALAGPEDMKGKKLKDFTVKTISGERFSLSESLKTHDLVLINFWATWCGPCCMEFPYLETAWKQYSDRVDVIALSVESTDTVSKLKKFAKEYDLSFPIGRDEKGMYATTDSQYIPTTLIVDKDRRVVYVDVGAKASAEEFTDLFEKLLPSQASKTSYGGSPWSGGGDWPEWDYDGINTSLRSLSDSSKRHQSWFTPNKGVGAGAYKPYKVTNAVALFREGDYVLVDLSYQTVGRRCVYFKASSLSHANVESVNLKAYSARVTSSVQPQFGPGYDYNGVTSNQKDKKTGKTITRNVTLSAGTSVDVFFEMDGWVFCEFSCSLGVIRAWLPASCVE